VAGTSKHAKSALLTMQYAYDDIGYLHIMMA
jgi:hypothetical protein